MFIKKGVEEEPAAGGETKGWDWVALRPNPIPTGCHLRGGTAEGTASCRLFHTLT